MTVNLPLIAILALIAWLVFKYFHLRLWVVAALVLFGFYLAHTVMAPAIDHSTRTGVQIVNTRH